MITFYVYSKYTFDSNSLPTLTASEPTYLVDILVLIGRITEVKAIELIKKARLGDKSVKSTRLLFGN